MMTTMMILMRMVLTTGVATLVCPAPASPWAAAPISHPSPLTSNTLWEQTGKQTENMKKKKRKKLNKS